MKIVIKEKITLLPLLLTIFCAAFSACADKRPLEEQLPPHFPEGHPRLG